MLFGEWENIVEGDTVKRTGRLLDIPVGEALLGRIVDPLGRPLDGKGDINTTETRPAEFKAPGVVQRQPVKEPMQTGLKAIDAMIPIGRGQRELIIGDRQTGKTAIAIDTIINNRDTGLVSVYVAIGQRMSTVVRSPRRSTEHGALENTIIVAAAADEAAPIKFIAPYAGCRDGRALPLLGPRGRSASTTTSPSTRTRTGRCRCCCAARRAARPTRATSSTSTRACSSGRSSSTTSSAAAR